MKYYTSQDLIIRSMLKEDAEIFYKTFLSCGWHSRLETYLNYYREQEEGKRFVFVAEHQGSVAGYCTLMINPVEGPFGNQGIPEVVDFNVFMDKRKQGIGSKLLDVVEAEAAKLCNRIYLSVGLHHGYGSAQRIYVKRGYIPDGSGVWYRDRQLEQYAQCCNDDDLLLYFIKTLY